jgi:hypothetical protein
MPDLVGLAGARNSVADEGEGDHQSRPRVLRHRGNPRHCENPLADTASAIRSLPRITTNEFEQTAYKPLILPSF